MKKRKQPILRTTEQEDSAVKKELKRWWDLLGLKIMAFNNAEEDKRKALEMETEIKCWHDKYDLKNKDNHLLGERILNLEESIELIKKESLEREKEIKKKLSDKIKKLEEDNAALLLEQKENKKTIKELTSRIRQLENKEINDNQRDEIRLWEKGQTVALKKLRERKKKVSATNE